MKDMIKLLLVDNEKTVRQGLRMRLDLEPDLTIVGEAETGIEALKLTQVVQPDVVVMDVDMPAMDGITATKGLQSMSPPVTVVISSIHDDAQTRCRAKVAGAAAFVGKQEGVELLIDTIRQTVKHD